MENSHLRRQAPTQRRRLDRQIKNQQRPGVFPVKLQRAAQEIRLIPRNYQQRIVSISQSSFFDAGY
jgi:hypothetical protein